MKLDLCIATRRRPEGLARLLDALVELVPPAGVELELVVVDNDAAGSAEPICAAARGRLRWPLRYVVEPAAGIPFARNRCLREAAGADLIAFIDDDEVPGATWLADLVGGLAQARADVATGPVRYRLPAGTPPHIEQSGVFERQTHPTGTRRSVAYTHNVVFRRAILDALEPWFDERMATTGGSDAHLFRRVHAAGFRIVWVDEAQVTEHVPPERATLDWVARRSFRVGSTMTWARRDRYGELKAVPLTLLSCARWAGTGSAQALLGALRGGGSGKRTAVRGLRHLSYAAGIVYGSFGQYDAYPR